jgi:hypothetical protein
MEKRFSQHGFSASSQGISSRGEWAGLVSMYPERAEVSTNNIATLHSYRLIVPGFPVINMEAWRRDGICVADA